MVTYRIYLETGCSCVRHAVYLEDDIVIIQKTNTSQTEEKQHLLLQHQCGTILRNQSAKNMYVYQCDSSYPKELVYQMIETHFKDLCIRFNTPHHAGCYGPCEFCYRFHIHKMVRQSTIHFNSENQ